MAEIKICISDIVNKMEPEEKGAIKGILLYGKKFQKKVGEIISSQDALRKYVKDVDGDWVSIKLEEAFKEGTGVMDVFKNISNNYGKQLDIIIKDVLVKSLKTTKPMFSKDINTVEGTLQREGWIAEKLMDSLILNIDDDAKKEIVKQIGEMLNEKGVDPGQAAQASAALLTGGLTAAKAVLGFNFHILVAQISNLIVRMLANRGLSLAVNAALQRSVVGFLFLPIGWTITAVTSLPLITTLINPRGYDKYIPAVFLIGINRLSELDKQERDNVFSNNLV
jgi:uncharacterized protein YaaW (UPF0174 family)